MSDVIVTSEPLTYEPDSPNSFFGDLARSQLLRDPQSEERLERHSREVSIERRTMTTAAGFGGDLALPMYMIDRFKTTARASRPLADLLNPILLPKGTRQINIPRTVQTGIAATETATMVDGAGVNETDPTTATNSSNVVTIAGQILASQQLVDQVGANPGADIILATELKRDYDAALEAQLLTGSGTSGQLTGLSSFSLPAGHSISGASVGILPTTATTGLWPLLGQASAAIGNDRGRFPEAWLMAPRRWASIASSLDNSNRPIASPGGGSFHMMDDSPPAGHQAPFGPVLGIPVYCDGAIPTTSTDVIWAIRPEDMYLFESDPTVSMNFDTTANATLGVRVVFHASVAFIGNLYTSSVAVITALPKPTNF